MNISKKVEYGFMAVGYIVKYGIVAKTKAEFQKAKISKMVK